MPSSLAPGNLSGVRVFDDFERAHINRLGVEIKSINHEAPLGAMHLHIDLDVIDAASFPFTTYPSVGGPTIDELASAVTSLLGTGRVRSAAVTECAAQTMNDVQLLEPLLGALRAWINERTFR